MATLKATLIANKDARPDVKNASQVSGGRSRDKAAKFEFDGTQANADVLRFHTIKSNDRVKSMKLSCDALTGLTSVDFGLYDTDDGAVVDDDLFDSAQTLATALVRQEKRVGSDSALGIETLDQMVWQLLGLTADPNKTYDVCGLINTSGSASGTVVLETEYTAGD